jgi:imidazolonepropionase-like amidohydrolase
MASLALKNNAPIDLESIVTPWKLRCQTTYVFTNASVIDPLDGSVKHNATVRLSGGLVVSVGERVPEAERAEEGVEEVDLHGKYILPGLWDCHVHLGAVQGSTSLDEILEYPAPTGLLRQPEVGQAMIDRGFTTVRDCGGALLPLKEAFEAGIHPGPRLFIAGRQLTQSGGSGDHRPRRDDSDCCGGARQLSCRTVDGVPECLKFSREELRLGADFIKIMGGGAVASPRGSLGDIDFTDEEIRAITTVTSNAGTFTTAHAYTPQVIQHAIHNGVLGIEHGNYLDKATAELMAEKGVFLTPTLVTYAAGVMPEFHEFISEHSRKKLQNTLERGIDAIKIAKEAGVTICFGTDLLGPMHFAQTKEFVLRRSVQTPLEIIQSATVNPARMMKHHDSLGRVAPGFIADLLILNDNPLEDITVLDRPDRHLLAVFKEGRLMTSRWSRLEPRSRRPVIIL